MHLAIVLACAKGPANAFVNSWYNAEWHSDAAEIGAVICHKMTALEQDAAWPAGESNTAQMQRRAFRLASIIKQLNTLVARQPHKVGWIRSQSVICQLLATVQRQLKAHHGEVWQMPPPRPVVYKLSIEAQLAMEKFDMSSAATKGKVKAMRGQARQLKPKQRHIGSRIGTTCSPRIAPEIS